MKKITAILVILNLIFSYSTFAQCKFKRDEVDEFTKKQVRETKEFLVAGGFPSVYAVQLRKVDDNYFFEFVYSTTGTDAIVIGKGDEFMIKLKNDSVVKLKAVDIATANHTNTNGHAGTNITCDYNIDKKQLELLSTVAADKIRVYTAEGYIDKELTDNGKERLQSFAGCIVK